MDPAVATLDPAKAGAIIADMIESYLAGGAPPSNPEGADHDDLQDCRSTSVTASLHLHPSIDAGASPLQSGEHRAPIQTGEQGEVHGLESGTDPDSRPGSRPVRRQSDKSRGLQDAGQRCGNGSRRGHLLAGGVAASTIEPGLASPARVVRHHQHAAEFNDGLVLGMKGTFAQAELHIIRARLHGGKLNKAQKGELRLSLPVGLVFDGENIVLDPDQEVEGAVRAVFELFEQESSAYAVVRRFQERGLRFPRRQYGGAWDGKLIWGRLTHSRVLGILANPSYAGTYVFGRYQSSKQIGPSGEISTRSRPMPQEAWRVTIRDHHEGYINWDQFLANRHRLA